MARLIDIGGAGGSTASGAVILNDQWKSSPPSTMTSTSSTPDIEAIRSYMAHTYHGDGRDPTMHGYNREEREQVWAEMVQRPSLVGALACLEQGDIAGACKLVRGEYDSIKAQWKARTDLMKGSSDLIIVAGADVRRSVVHDAGILLLQMGLLRANFKCCLEKHLYTGQPHHPRQLNSPDISWAFMGNPPSMPCHDSKPTAG